MYYGLVGIAVVMFGFMFLSNKKYSEEMGNGIFAAMFLNALGALSSLPILFAIGGFAFEYTHFTLLMSAATFANSLLFTLCSLKSLEIVNLSVYSLLSMLGGMILPVVVGVLFFREKMTIGIALCLVFIILALLLTVDTKKSGDKRALLYYIGVFVFNGMSGVISKIYVGMPFEKASNEGYSLLSAIFALGVSLIFLLTMRKKECKITKTAVLYGAATGPLSRIANYLLLLALTVLPASVNYPLVTGGTIIVTTILGYFTEKKPTARDWAAVTLSFVGIMFLTLLPI